MAGGAAVLNRLVAEFRRSQPRSHVFMATEAKIRSLTSHQVLTLASMRIVAGKTPAHRHRTMNVARGELLFFVAHVAERLRLVGQSGLPPARGDLVAGVTLLLLCR